MWGAIIGDIVGSPYEFTRNSIKTTDFPLFSETSKYTDDTVMTVAVSEGIMSGYGSEDATKEAIIDAMHTYGRLYPWVGYGMKFFRWIAQRNREPYNSFGNGSAMRVSSVAWAYDTLEEVERYALISAAVTHNHPEGIKGACSTAAAIFMGRNGATKADIQKYLERKYDYDFSRTLNDIRPGYYHVESCQESVPEAITAFLESDGFEDALRKAVSLGGDSDTIAAIAGSIAEGFYGTVPQQMKCKALEMLDIKLRNAVEHWEHWLKTKK